MAAGRKWTVMGVLLFLGATASGVLLFGPESAGRAWWFRGAWTLAALFTALRCLQTAMQLDQRDLRRAWWLMCAGCGAWLAGTVFWMSRLFSGAQGTAVEVGRDAGVLLLPPLAILGLSFLRVRALPGLSAFRKVCNLGIIIGALLVLALIGAGGEVARLQSEPVLLARVLGYWVPGLAAALFGVLCLLAYAEAQLRRVLVLTVLGLLAHGLTNLLWGRSLLTGEAPEWWFSLGWPVGFAFLFWAGFEQVVAARELSSREAAAQGTVWGRDLDTLLPSLTLLALLLLGHRLAGDNLPPLWRQLFPVALALVGLLGLRDWWSRRTELRSLETLRVSEDRLRRLVDSSLAGIFFWEPEGRITGANDTLLQQTGFTREDLRLGRVNWLDFTPAEFMRLDQKALADLAATGVCAPFEKEYVRKDGSRLPVLVGSALIGTSGAGVSFVIELTARKREEGQREAVLQLVTALNEVNDRRLAARKILEAVRGLVPWDAASLDFYDPVRNELQPVLIMDEVEGSLVEVPQTYGFLEPSQFLAGVLGGPGRLVDRVREAALDLGLASFGAQERRPMSLLFVPLRQGGTVSGLMSVQSVRAGAYTEQHLHLLQAVGERVAGALERIRGGESLQQSEARYRALVDEARDAIFTLSTKGLLLSLNPVFESTLGWPREEWLNKPFVSLVLLEDRTVAQSKFNQAMRGERPPAFELRLNTKGGKQVVVEFTISPRREHDRIVAVVGVGRDVTRRRQLEQQLQQSRRLESIGQLAGGVAHDFNNILTVIDGHAVQLRSHPDLPPDAVESAAEIARAAGRAATLTRQLLAFSRRQVFRPADVDLNQAVGELLKMLQRILGEDIKLEFKPAAELPQVHADVAMIEQVLLNLAVNARDAMPDGGRLEVSTASLHLDTAGSAEQPRKPGRYVCVTVSDTGEGIAPENLPHVFEPFFTTKEVGQGTGMGLATVYGIIQQHGGWIEVTSEPGAGATFRVFLPVAPVRVVVPVVEKPTPTIRVPAPATKGGELILVVEDEEPVRKLVRVVLQRVGYRVVEAASGLQALEVWNQQGAKVDLLLTDLVMPDGMSGRELAERLRVLRPGLAIVLTSGYSAEMAGKNLELLPEARFIQKPFRAEELLKVVRETLADRGGSPPAG